MLLYLLRHAEAVQQGQAFGGDDSARPLTEKGYDQSRRVGEFLKARKMDIELILTSPVLRARETAGIVAKTLADTDLSEVPWLACGMRPETALKELGVYSRFKSVMIVGHEPDISALIARFVNLENDSSVDIGKASLTAIELPRILQGVGILKFLIPVKLL